jgi:tetratricopeptide (TPR) repeat protein
VFIRQRLISALGADGAGPDVLLKIYLEAPKEQRDGYLFNRGLLRTFENAGKWNEAADYLKTVDRRWSNDVRSWYDFCIGYADNLLEESRPQEALQWIAKSTPTPDNLSDINLSPDYFYRQHEYFLSGQAYKIMGETSKSQEFFRKVIDEQTDFMFNASDELRLAQLRFYVALSMKELGMEPAGRGMLVGINACRLKFGLVTLILDKSEMDRWNTKDPLSESAGAE